VLQHIKLQPRGVPMPGLPTGTFHNDVWKILWKWGREAADSRREHLSGMRVADFANTRPPCGQRIDCVLN
jgi:hypothetical protein